MAGPVPVLQGLELAVPGEHRSRLRTWRWLRRDPVRSEAPGRMWRPKRRRASLPAFGELDRVLGGGLVPGSVVLIGGEPGAGKSTLLLQMCCQLAAQSETLYVTGEESLQQLALRASRLSLPMDRLQVASETRAEAVAGLIETSSRRWSFSTPFR